MGPETTAEFYMELVFGTFKKNSIQRPPILIWSVPLKYKTEREYLEQVKGENQFLRYLLDAARRLEEGGADFIVMPCNTLHVFIAQIRKAVKIPVLNIVEETVQFLQKKRITSVGVLATPASIQNHLYGNALDAAGIQQAYPDGFDQAKLGKMMARIVQSEHGNRDREEFLKIIGKFRRKKIKHVILACTDLQIFIPTDSKLHIYDTMKILIDAAIKEMIDQRR